MIDERRSNLDERIVTVPVGKFVFPSECLLCGDRRASPTRVILKRTLCIGIASRLVELETIGLPISLCPKHSIEYHERVLARTVKIYFCLAAGMALALGGAFWSDQQRQSAFPVVVMFTGLALLGSWIWLSLKRPADFPVKLHTRERRQSEYTAFELTFPDDDSWKRFIAANSDKDKPRPGST